MAVAWLSGAALRHLDDIGPENVRDELRSALGRVLEDPITPGAFVRFDEGELQLVATRLPGSHAVAVMELSVPGRAASPSQKEWRSILFPDDVLEGLLAQNAEWAGVLARIIDTSNIDETRERKGLKFLQQGRIATIFVSGGYHRLHFVIDEAERLATIQGIFDAERWSTHKGSKGLTQPLGTELRAWARTHQEAARLRSRESGAIRDALGERQTAAPPPAEDLPEVWITRHQLRDMGVTSANAMNAVLRCRTEDDLLGALDHVTDEQFSKIEAALARHSSAEQRKAEGAIGFMEVLALNARTRHDDQVARSFDAWLEILTPQQRRVVTLDHDVAIRVKGGPGTGKTLTAVLRAVYLAKRARERGVPAKVGFFVFSRDLGLRVYEQFAELGLGDYLDGSTPQKLEVTSLQTWCEKFVDVEKLNVEPIAPYRAEKTEKNRRALMEIALEEARKRLLGPDYDALWKDFDLRSKNGLWEVETEISQFIKARTIMDLQTYLAERRPANWWLANTDKAFRRFVWEIYTIYQEALQTLCLIDSDDLINDAIKEVTKSVWQQFVKPKEGFDYLVLDEAQDFFRNQLTLIRHLVKRPEGLMICYDEAQAVYSRYPTLREIGFDTDSSFEGLRLEQNFRSTREILASVQALVSRYPTCAFLEWRGNFIESANTQSGPRPVSYGYGNESAMLDEARDLVQRHIEDGEDASDIALVAFDEALLERAKKMLEDRKIKAHSLAGRGRRPPRGAVVLADAKNVKGMQFQTCITLGLGRDHIPDFRGVQNDLQREMKREDYLRLFLVAISRCKRNLHLLWHGTEPSEFITAMGDTVDRRG